MTSIADRVASVRTRIETAARRSGRNPSDVCLVAVTKNHPTERVAVLLDAGVTHLGESRLQEAEPKIAALSEYRHHITWHGIGHVQRNKAKATVRLFNMLHSLDSVRLAAALDHQIETLLVAGEHLPNLVDGRLPVLIQVNVSGETTKEGFDLPGGLDNHERLPHFLAEVNDVLASSHLSVQGLMTIAPRANDPEYARPIFRSLRIVRDALAEHFPKVTWGTLSMGMTDDFEVAIEEGATMVRVGRALLGERNMR